MKVPKEAAGERLDRFLARELALPVERVRARIAAGEVRVRGKACSPLRKLFGGEGIALAAPKKTREPPRGPDLAVLYDDPDCLVVNKPAGLAVEAEGPKGEGVLTAARRLGPFSVGGRNLPGLPHRLDRDTTGALLLARSDRALAALRRAFERGAVEKHYLALVAGAPPAEGQLDTPYGRDPKDPRRFTTRVSSARRARLTYRVLSFFPGAALLAVHLDTGRTHQIRVQLGEAGFPVLGDLTYGVPGGGLLRQGLHAVRLAFPRPKDGERVEVSAPLPQDLALAIGRLEAEA